MGKKITKENILTKYCATFDIRSSAYGDNRSSNFSTVAVIKLVASCKMSKKIYINYRSINAKEVLSY